MAALGRELGGRACSNDNYRYTQQAEWVETLHLLPSDPEGIEEAERFEEEHGGRVPPWGHVLNDCTHVIAAQFGTFDLRQLHFWQMRLIAAFLV